MIPAPHPAIVDLLDRNERLLGLLNEARSSERRTRELFPEVAAAIRVDSRRKEERLYPAVRDADRHGAQLVRAAKEEHRLIDWMIDDAERIGPDGEGWIDQTQYVFSSETALLMSERRDMVPVLESRLTSRQLDRLEG